MKNESGENTIYKWDKNKNNDDNTSDNQPKT